MTTSSTVSTSVGSGPEVVGAVEDILLAIAGRHVSDTELTGDGLAILTQRA